MRASAVATYLKPCVSTSAAARPARLDGRPLGAARAGFIVIA
jgi:hypothetical protein